jgi:hypothetical protein
MQGDSIILREAGHLAGWLLRVGSPTNVKEVPLSSLIRINSQKLTAFKQFFPGCGSEVVD